jgi:hypothetical protein
MKKIIILMVLSFSLQGCFQVCGSDSNILLCLSDGSGDSSTSDSGSSWSDGGSSWGGSWGDRTSSWSDGGSSWGGSWGR